jgi:hypothetical protein
VLDLLEPDLQLVLAQPLVVAEHLVGQQLVVRSSRRQFLFTSGFNVMLFK